MIICVNHLLITTPLSKTLTFSESPDYHYLVGLFRHALIRHQ